MGLFGFMETKVKARRFSKVFGKEWSIVTNYSAHNSGRIWLTWLPSIFSVSSCKVGVQYIHTLVTHRASMKSFWVTMVYGLNDASEREKLWEQIFDLATSISEPWLIAGDFNNILNLEDKLGSPCTIAEVKKFRTCLRSNDQMDFNTGGMFFTWNNKQEGRDKVCTKIDRVIVYRFWLSIFPHFSAEFLPEGLMDQSPCCMKLDNQIGNVRKPFRFFNMWTEAPDFLEIVKDAWNCSINGTPMFRVKVNSDPTNEDLLKQEYEARAEYAKAHQNQNGEMINAPDKIAETFVSYYQKLLGSDEGEVMDIHTEVIQAGQVLSESQKHAVIRPFTENDVRNAL
ncbi:uncharacterized protein LOC110717281 [Chenopodium quinoa]|uniref:uncharacterized protein LOC110717281 n=1 Tax=Chenopodium quinoa TaxID=63459 RepID=UPI000B78F06F|nr:uncharacterized protein LOC110717281 [Chenopodium quinoa]